MPGPLKNARHERFVQALLKGKTLEASQVEAGFKPNKANAGRMKARPDVAARLAELKERVAAKAVVTAADIAKQLDKDRKFARTKGQAAAAVSATLGKAKVLGLIVDRQQHQFDLSGLSDEDLDALERIRERIAKP